jgi:ammonia channel protein AmtB
MIWAIDALEYLRIDDPIGAVPVHGFCGICPVPFLLIKLLPLQYLALQLCVQAGPSVG